jgi:hypothetical protein
MIRADSLMDTGFRVPSHTNSFSIPRPNTPPCECGTVFLQNEDTIRFASVLAITFRKDYNGYGDIQNVMIHQCIAYGIGTDGESFLLMQLLDHPPTSSIMH